MLDLLKKWAEDEAKCRKAEDAKAKGGEWGHVWNHSWEGVVWLGRA